MSNLADAEIKPVIFFFLRKTLENVTVCHTSIPRQRMSPLSTRRDRQCTHTPYIVNNTTHPVASCGRLVNGSNSHDCQQSFKRVFFLASV